MYRPPTIGIVADASCYGGTGSKARDGYYHGKVEWQCYDLTTRTMVVRSHLQKQSTINLGEYLAIVDAMQYLRLKGDHTTPIYSDSQICINWIIKGYTNTALPLNEHTRPALDELADAQLWVQENCPENPVYWWDKYRFGNNPADYGRK